MSLYNAMTTAISGMNAQSNKMGNISDNIANVSTLSYKKIGTSFSTLVTASSRSMHNPAGVSSAPQYNIGLGGNIQASSSPTSMAIDGNGFFPVQNAPNTTDTVGLDKQRFYTRKGDFTADKDGNLVNSSGYYLLGWQYDIPTGDLVSKNLVPVNVGNLTGMSQRTKTMTIGADLPATGVKPLTAAPTLTAPVLPATLSTMPSLDTADYYTEQVVYDGQGIPHTMRTAYFPVNPAAGATKADSWTVVVGEKVTDPGDGKSVWVTHGQIDGLKFNEDGSMKSTTGTAVAGSYGTAVSMTTTGDATFTINPTGATGWSWTTGDKITMEFGTYDAPKGLTQSGVEFANTYSSQDGQPYGQYESLSTDKYGDVYAHFSNGMEKKVFRVPMIVFSNPDGLQMTDGGAYSATPDAGDPIIVEAGVGRAGTFVPESLEGSNVDLAEEFTNMIQAQRAYSANSKVITTSDQMMDDVIRLIR